MVEVSVRRRRYGDLYRQHEREFGDYGFQRMWYGIKLVEGGKENLTEAFLFGLKKKKNDISILI